MKLVLTLKAGNARTLTRVIEGPTVIQPEAFYLCADSEGPRSWLVEPEPEGAAVLVYGPDMAPLGRLGVGGRLSVGDCTLSLDDGLSRGAETEPMAAVRVGVPMALRLPDGREHLLSGGALTVGSHRECDVVVHDRAVSARHCEIAMHNGRWRITDLQSTNGTFLAEHRVGAAELRPGMVITLGRSRIEVRASTRAAPRAEGLLVGESPVMNLLRAGIRTSAGSPYPVMIQGPSGAGKELVAREIHAHSRVKDGPFVTVNCGAIAANVIESELFGHERGAFTGADRRRRGLFEEAHGGTLFLDEVGELSPEAQKRLLRVLEEGKIRRVGGEQEIAVKVRVVSATWRDLEAMTREGSFRLDLYYRLKGYDLYVPPLRERKSDVLCLVGALLARIATETGRLHGIDDLAMGALIQHDWPGNVRELLFVLRKAALLADGPMIFLHHVQAAGVVPPTREYPPFARPLGLGARGLNDTALGRPDATTLLAPRVSVGDLEALHTQCDGNLSRLSLMTGLSRTTLRRKLQRVGAR